MVGEGLLDLDEPLDRLLPELANSRLLRRMDGTLDDTLLAAGPVTVRGLLTFMAPDLWPVVAAATQAGVVWQLRRRRTVRVQRGCLSHARLPR